MAAQQEKRGPGRPPEGKTHIDLTLSNEVVQFLRAMPAGKRSRFVDECLRQSQEYQAFQIDQMIAKDGSIII